MSKIERAPRSMDDEANDFAMELLMPTEWLLRDIKELGGIDIEDDSKLAKLAKRYRVSQSVMPVRIGMLREQRRDRSNFGG